MSISSNIIITSLLLDDNEILIGSDTFNHRQNVSAIIVSALTAIIFERYVWQK